MDMLPSGVMLYNLNHFEIAFANKELLEQASALDMELYEDLPDRLQLFTMQSSEQ